MPRNIEIKARVHSVEVLLPRARALADDDAEVIDQDDSFFAVARGRLKLREFADGSAELIQYHRRDVPQAKASDYMRVPVADAAALRQVLTRACDGAGRVRKRRLLLRVGQTRVHLDQVEDLGAFIELEVVLNEGQSDADGRDIAERLMLALGLGDAPRTAVAYVDLLSEPRP